MRSWPNVSKGCDFSCILCTEFSHYFSFEESSDYKSVGKPVANGEESKPIGSLPLRSLYILPQCAPCSPICHLARSPEYMWTPRTSEAHSIQFCSPLLEMPFSGILLACSGPIHPLLLNSNPRSQGECSWSFPHPGTCSELV